MRAVLAGASRARQVARFALLPLLLLTVATRSHCSTDDDVLFTNEFAVEINGDETIADLVAGTHGCLIKRELTQLGNYYVFKYPEVAHRHKRHAVDIVEKLQRDPNVKFVEQQRLLKREKRRAVRHYYDELPMQRRTSDLDNDLDTDLDSDLDPELLELAKRVIIHDKQIELPIRRYKDPSVYQRYNHDNDKFRSRGLNEHNGQCEVNFKDPLYRDQWYLDNRGQSGGPVGHDVNVLCVWKKGITGKGVVVSILDDGLDHKHPDLAHNYDPRASNNLNDPEGESRDPSPNLKDPSNTHGTRCAGEVAAQANNSVCGVGIAFNARIGGVRMLDGAVTDALEAEALTFENQYIDIYSASWGPPDNGKTMEAPHKLCKAALKKGSEEGRGGKGSLFVWATGNGGMYGDTCSCDGYVSSIYTLSVGCISDEGLSTYFTEICPSTMAVIYTGGAHKMPGEIEQRNPKIKIVTTDPIDGCTLEFQGTSSAAPLAAGLFALVLEANPNLTWRDMQHIVVHTARIPSGQESGWIRNGAGYHVNPRFGFGSLDAGKMVEAAQEWKTVPEQHTCEVESDDTEWELPSRGNITAKLYTDGCKDNKDHVINYLEHVEVHIELEASRRGDINMFLISPQGMRSEILRVRPKDDAKTGIDFTFMTVFNFGENPKGNWTLEIHDKQPEDSKRKENTGKLLRFGLTLYGTETKPDAKMYSDKSVLERASNPKLKKASTMDTADLLHTLHTEGASSENLNLRNGPEQKDSEEKEEKERVIGDLNANRAEDNEIEDYNILLSQLEKMLEEDQR